MNIAKWQIISFISRGIAMALGIFQSFFIVRLLTVGEYGIVQIAASIGGAFGIYQHLGLSSGSTREISSAKDDTEIFKIFTTSLVIRYLVTIPIAVVLFLSAKGIAESQYGEPALELPLKIYSVVILIQGCQGMINSIIAGTKRFRQLFIYQAAIAVVSVLLYIPLVYVYKINGYFYALLAFNFIATFVLAVIAFKPLHGKIALPTFAEFKILLKELLSISLGIYVVKVIYTMWEKAGPILLGREVSPEIVGLFAFALLFAKKLSNVSDAVTDINLPVFSEKFVTNIQDFKSAFAQNFNKVFVFILLSAFTATFWSKELITFIVGGDKYDLVFPLILPLVFTFIFYSLIDIIKSSIFVPAKFVKEMVLGFVLFLIVTIGIFFGAFSFLNKDPLFSITLGMLLGALTGLVYLVLISQKKLRFKYISHSHVLLLSQAFIIGLAKDIDDIYLKIAVFIVFSLLYIWGAFVAKFIIKEDLLLVSKVINRFKTS